MTIVVKLANNATSLPSSLTLKNNALASTNRRLDALLDVEADDANTVTGSTLVYDAAQDKYIVKQLDLDGGSF